MTIEIITILMLISVLLAIILGFPIGLSLAGIATIFGLVFFGPQVADIFALRLFGTFSDYILVAVPLFVFMGFMIEKTGIAMRLFDATYVIFGKLRGGLAVATVITCTIFAAATGIVGASVVIMGIIALPAMLKYKYEPQMATGAICAGGTLGILIPPSIMLLVYGPTAGLSVGLLFSAAFAPGILLSILYILYIILKCYLNPVAGPAASDDELLKIPLAEKVKLFVTSILPVMGLILAVLGTIFFGLASPTEAAALGAFFSTIMALIYRKVNFNVLKDVVIKTLQTSAMVFAVLIGASFFTAVFMRLGGDGVVRNFILGLPFGELGTIIVMLLTIVILGMFIDWIGIIMIMVPIFTPIAAEIGWNPIWFAMLIIVTLQTSFLTPPFAGAIFYLKGVSPPGIETKHIISGVWPFIGLQIIAITLCYIFPEIVLFFPKMFGLL